NPLTSRGFSCQKMLGLITGAWRPDEAKIEYDIANRLDQVYRRNQSAYTYGGRGPAVGGVGGSYLAPLSTSFMQDEYVDPGFRQEMKDLVTAGTAGADEGEMRWMRQRYYKSLGYNAKALSWL